jgi:hypothetical protein
MNLSFIDRFNLSARICRTLMGAFVGFAVTTVFAQNVLNSGQTLSASQQMKSTLGRYAAVMQADGKLVIYRTAGGTALWSTGTTDGVFTAMQGDGNLVLYNSTGIARWNAGTAGNVGAYVAIQDDGNLVVYSMRGAPLWNKGVDSMAAAHIIGGQSLRVGQQLVSSQGKYMLIMQSDGNLVLYRISDMKAIWYTKTTDGVQAAMQTDGNLVVYNAAGVARWNSASHSTGAFLLLQDDGNLVIYNNGWTPMWFSGADKTSSSPPVVQTVPVYPMINNRPNNSNAPTTFPASSFPACTGGC